MIADPFALLTKEIYVSGHLTLFAAPRGVCSDWTMPGHLSTHAHWHRRLDANAFLWLRGAVRRAIESGNLADEFQDALERLEWIRGVGIEYGSFTADDVAEGNQAAPAWYSFNAGLPRWADDIGPDFLPPRQKPVKAALTRRS